MMKKSPGLWLLLSVGVLWLCFQDVTCVRATSLIFGKSTTTSTTPPPPNESSTTAGDGTAPASEETPSEAMNNSTQTAKSNYTGIPQVDYQWDPNLPRELNGFNLTEYPFYDRLPEDIDFKCDGLHDGFYASVRHKCQVYHHCLFGTRYDFLCANYTAFDQKTFICHFVSEVDCANSKKFWHRNDALYEAASTTTVKPQVIHTPPPSPPSPAPTVGRRPPHPPRRRKPARRRRPQYEYYDEYEEADEEYYDEPRYTATESPRSEGRRRNQRPRPRPRPIYEDDDYDDYDDDRYDRRRGSSRRGEDERRYKSRPSSRRSNKDDRRKTDDVYEEYEEEDSRYEERRNKKPRPSGDERKRPSEEEQRRPRPRKGGSRRPTIPEDDYVEEERRPSKRKEDPPGSDDKALVKPVGSSVYDRPRVAPKIKPPVPKNEADKYAYKTTVRSPVRGAEYYDEDYEEKKPSKDSMPDASIASNMRKTNAQRGRESETRRNRPKPHTKRPIHEEEYVEEEEEEQQRPNKRPTATRNGQGSRKRPAAASFEYEEEYEERAAVNRQEAKATTTTPNTPTVVTTLRRKFVAVKDTTRKSSTTSTTTTTTTSTTQAPHKEEAMGPVKTVRIVKRPFLPSRGGNPYQPRGLQPVGLKSEQSVRKSQETRQPDPPPKEEEAMEEKPLRPAVQTTAARQVYKSSNKETTKAIEKNPLDINESEYDVTLNDALNPTLPNLPLRSFPSAFSNNVNNEYSSYFYRPRYVVDASVHQPNGHGPQSPDPVAQQQSHPDVAPQFSHNYHHFRVPPRISPTFYASF